MRYICMKCYPNPSLVWQAHPPNTLTSSQKHWSGGLNFLKSKGFWPDTTGPTNQAIKKIATSHEPLRKLPSALYVPENTAGKKIFAGRTGFTDPSVPKCEVCLPQICSSESGPEFKSRCCFNQKFSLFLWDTRCLTKYEGLALPGTSKMDGKQMRY